MNTPRFINISEHEEIGDVYQYSWKEDKISVHPSIRDDVLLLQNIFSGMIISPFVYPLIFEKKSKFSSSNVRSIPYYQEFLSDRSLYDNLSKQDKIYFLIGLRDLFIASTRKILSNEEENLLKNVVNLISSEEDQTLIYREIGSMKVTPYPTARNKLVRFMEGFGESLTDQAFIKNELNLLIVFVDPCELSFHNLENIINLDSVFQKDPEFKIHNFEKLDKGEVYTFDLEDQKNILISLNNFELYTIPLNNISRGGERFIFHSAKLAGYFTNLIKASVKKKAITTRFRLVNSVFRYNKFKPQDKKFTSHFDTPYYDPERGQFSKFTMIIYLTKGKNDSVLTLDNGTIAFSEIDFNMQARGIIFDQKYEHEGHPYINGDKIFLRTELIYEIQDDIAYVDEIARQFNIACYMTKQSIFKSELDKYASDLFNHVAKARVNLSQASVVKDKFLFKKYLNTCYLTNGYDYWFKNDIEIAEAAIICLLDQFNCKLESKEHFNKMTFDSILEIDYIKPDDAIKILKEFSYDNQPQKKLRPAFKELIEKNYSESDDDDSEYNPNEDDGRYDAKFPFLKSLEAIKYFKPPPTSNGYELKKDLDKQIIEEKGDNECKNSFVLQKNVEENNPMQPKSDSNSEKDSSSQKGRDSEKDKNGSKSEPENFCCVYHNYMGFDDEDEDFTAYQCKDVLKAVQNYNMQEEPKIKLFRDEFPITIFGREIIIQRDRLKVSDNTITFENDIPAVNFAACWNGCYPENFIEKKKTEILGFKSIPPIRFVQIEGGYHMRIELFSNSFVRKERREVFAYSVCDADPKLLPYEKKKFANEYNQQYKDWSSDDSNLSHSEADLMEYICDDEMEEGASGIGKKIKKS